MKHLNDYTIVTIPDDNGTFIAHIPAIQGCQCLGRRIPDMETLEGKVAAWQDDRNHEET